MKSHGKESEAILYCSGPQLGKCSQKMKTYSKTANGCLREKLYQSFDKNIEKADNLHDCCSNCHLLCKCKGDTCDLPKPLYIYETSDVEEKGMEFERHVTDEQKELLNELLLDYKAVLERKCMSGCFVSKHNVTGFSEKVIEEVIDNCHRINSIDYVMENIPVLHISDAKKIMYMINDVFEDIAVTNIDKNYELVDTDVQQYQFEQSDFDEASDSNSEEDDNLNVSRLSQLNINESGSSDECSVMSVLDMHHSHIE